MHTVENTRPSLLRIGGRKLLPGTNLVEIDDLLDPKKAKNKRSEKWSKTFYTWAGLGWLKWSKAKPGDKPGVESPATLRDYDETAALAVIATEANQRVLAKWLNAEKRPDVVSLIKARLEELV